VKVLEDAAVKSGAAPRASAGETSMTVGIVNLAFIRVAKNAVGFGAFAKIDFGFFFIFGTSARTCGMKI